MRLVASALRVFAADVDAHRAGHCRGYPLVRGAGGPGGDPEVPRSLRAEARDAVRACPRRALTTVDPPGYA